MNHLRLTGRLWREYKYGADDADFKRLDDRLSYFNEAQSKQVDLIRYKDLG